VFDFRPREFFDRPHFFGREGSTQSRRRLSRKNERIPLIPEPCGRRSRACPDRDRRRHRDCGCARAQRREAISRWRRPLSRRWLLGERSHARLHARHDIRAIVPLFWTVEMPGAAWLIGARQTLHTREKLRSVQLIAGETPIPSAISGPYGEFHSSAVRIEGRRQASASPCAFRDRNLQRRA